MRPVHPGSVRLVLVLALSLAVPLAGCGGGGGGAPEPPPPDDGLLYAPSFDVFVVRGPASGTRTGVERFHAYQEQPPKDVLGALFAGDADPALSAFLEQAGVTAHVGRVRIFYVRLDPSRVGLEAITGRFTLPLTDDGGLVDKGLVHADPSTTFNVLFAGNSAPAADFTGIANLPGHEVMILSGGASYFGGPPAHVSRVLAHELGHDLGLYHSFESGTCSFQEQYQSNRVMDYSDHMDVFVPCERIIAKRTAAEFDHLLPAAHDPAADPTVEVYDGQWEGRVEIGAAAALAAPAVVVGPPPRVIVD